MLDTSAEGKGMGLFMVKTRVEALGGTIEVKSYSWYYRYAPCH